MDQPPAPPPDGSGPPPGPVPASGWSASGPGPGAGQGQPSVPPTAPSWAAPQPPVPPTSPGWAAPTPPPPPTAPGWAAPTPPAAPVGWAPPPVEPVGRRSTTGFAKAAGILLMVFGTLLGLFGLVFIAASTASRDLSEQFFGTVDARSIGDFVAGVGIVILVFAVIQIMGGIGSWRGSGWGRVIGLVYGVIGTLLGIGTLAGSGSSVRQGSVGSGLFILAVYGFITLALAFRWKSPAT